MMYVLNCMTAVAYWVLKGQSDLLVGVDDEDGSDGEGNSLLVDVGQVLLIEHILRSTYDQLLDVYALISYDSKLTYRWATFLSGSAMMGNWRLVLDSSLIL